MTPEREDKWEYKIEKKKEEISDFDLKWLGVEGWELASAISFHAITVFAEDYYIYYFKRKIQNL